MVAHNCSIVGTQLEAKASIVLDCYEILADLELVPCNIMGFIDGNLQ